MKLNFNKPKKQKTSAAWIFFTYAGRISFPEDKEVRIKDYNRKENRRVLRELREDQERD